MAFGATDTWICSLPTTRWLYEPCSASVSASTKPGQGASHNTWPFCVLFPDLKWASHGISAQTLTQAATARLTLGVCHSLSILYVCSRGCNTTARRIHQPNTRVLPSVSLMREDN